MLYGYMNSLTWLKTQFRRLGLKRRCSTPQDICMLIARNCIMVSYTFEIVSFLMHIMLEGTKII